MKAIYRNIALIILLSYACIALLTQIGWLGSTLNSQISAAHQGISWTHPLGTSALGLDFTALFFHAVRALFAQALPGAILALAIGALAGIGAGMQRGGWLDRLVLTAADVFDGVPGYLLLVAFAGVFRNVPGAMVLLLAASFWPSVARIVRIEVQRMSALPWSDAAKLLGLRPIQLITQQYLPVLKPVLWAAFLVTAADCVKAQVVLSFLGLDASTTWSFGTLIAEGSYDMVAFKFNALLVGCTGLLLFLLALHAQIRRITMFQSI